MKTLFPRGYHQYGFVASHALGHMMYGLYIYIYIYVCVCVCMYMYDINFVKYIETTSHSFKCNNISTLMNL